MWEYKKDEHAVSELIETVCVLHTDVDIVIQTVIQTVGIYHTDVQTADI